MIIIEAFLDWFSGRHGEKGMAIKEPHHNLFP
jgi:hypothetical protein